LLNFLVHVLVLFIYNKVQLLIFSSNSKPASTIVAMLQCQWKIQPACTVQFKHYIASAVLLPKVAEISVWRT